MPRVRVGNDGSATAAGIDAPIRTRRSILDASREARRRSGGDAEASRRRRAAARDGSSRRFLARDAWCHSTLDPDALRRTRATPNATDRTRVIIAERDGAPVPLAFGASRARGSPARARRAAVFARVSLRGIDARGRFSFTFPRVPVKTARPVRGNPRATPARRALVRRRCATRRTFASVDRGASARRKITSPLAPSSRARPCAPAQNVAARGNYLTQDSRTPEKGRARARVCTFPD
jgi:hypothetical protein